MGTNKTQLIFEGEPLWQRQIRLLRRLRPVEIFISAREKPAWCPQENEIVLDKRPSRGPMSGICAAFARTKSSHLFVLAVDMPFLLEQDLDSLVKSIERGCGIVPVIDGRAEPLAAIYPRESSSEFEAALSSNNRSMQSLVKQLTEEAKVKLAELSPREAERYRSVNTYADLTSVS